MCLALLRATVDRAIAIALLGVVLGLSTAAIAGPTLATQSDAALATLARVDDPGLAESQAAVPVATAAPIRMLDLASLTLPATWSPFAGSAIGADDNGTTPAPYALLGGLLIVVGLLARRFSASQRGLSKKT